MKKSKVMAIILTMVMAVSLFTIPASAENLSAADALAVLKHVVGTQLLSPQQMTKYGFTDKKAVTSADALSILKTVAGTTDTPTSNQTTTQPPINDGLGGGPDAYEASEGEIYIDMLENMIISHYNRRLSIGYIFELKGVNAGTSVSWDYRCTELDNDYLAQLTNLRGVNQNRLFYIPASNGEFDILVIATANGESYKAEYKIVGERERGHGSAWNGGAINNDGSPVGSDGDGTSTCWTCNGNGTTQCQACSGLGYRQRHSAAWNPDDRTGGTTREICSSCSGGRKTCNLCRGTGKR